MCSLHRRYKRIFLVDWTSSATLWAAELTQYFLGKYLSGKERCWTQLPRKPYRKYSHIHKYIARWNLCKAVHIVATKWQYHLFWIPRHKSILTIKIYGGIVIKRIRMSIEMWRGNFQQCLFLLLYTRRLISQFPGKFFSKCSASTKEYF